MNIFGLEIEFNFWFFFGMTAQFLFFARFIIQWIASERARKSVVPTVFWHISILGALMIAVYAYQRNDPVILFGTLLSVFIYSRNLILIYKNSSPTPPPTGPG